MGSKLAHVDLFFKVPKDFDGTIDDVLQLILDYRESNGMQEPEEKDYIQEVAENNSISKTGHNIMMIKKLLDGDRRLVGSVNKIEVNRHML
jgi:hypothetical protein